MRQTFGFRWVSIMPDKWCQVEHSYIFNIFELSSIHIVVVIVIVVVVIVVIIIVVVVIVVDVVDDGDDHLHEGFQESLAPKL